MIVAHRFIAICLLVFQLIMAVLYAVFVDYPNTTAEPTATYTANAATTFNVAAMVVVGFGMLLTHLRTASISGATFSLLIVAVTVQYYLLWMFLWQDVATGQFSSHPVLTQLHITKALFASASVLVSYATILGRVGPFELLLMVLVEVIGYSLNEMLCGTNFLNGFDAGGGMQVFTFGAVYGIVVVLFLSKEGLADNPKMSASPISQLFSLVGTLFLWVYWPSFNSALVVNTTDISTKEIVTNNTVFALLTSTLTAFIFSLLYNPKLQIRDIGLASLSGAIAISSGAQLIVNIGGVMFVCFFVGWISTSGYTYFSKYLQLYDFYDVTGTVNLFLIPGVFSGIFSAVFAAVYLAAPKYLPIVTTKAGREPYVQGGYQIACLFTTMGIAAVFGVVTGLILRRIAVYHREDLFDDQTHWFIPVIEEEVAVPPTSMNRRAQRYILELSKMDESFIKSPLVF